MRTQGSVLNKIFLLICQLPIFIETCLGAVKMFDVEPRPFLLKYGQRILPLGEFQFHLLKKYRIGASWCTGKVGDLEWDAPL